MKWIVYLDSAIRSVPTSDRAIRWDQSKIDFTF